MTIVKDHNDVKLVHIDIVEENKEYALYDIFG